MRSFTPLCGLLASLAIGTAIAQDEPDTGEHPDWPRWCGKVYMSGYPAFEPGGHTVEPPTNGSTYLHVQFKPRYSLYITGETTASFVVNAALSPWHGGEYENTTTDGATTEPFTELVFSISLAEDQSKENVNIRSSPLVQSKIAINATGVEFDFDLTQLEPQMTPYAVVLSGASVHGDRSYTATSELLYLPDNPDGSATKIDNANGGLLFKGPESSEFVPLLPYGFYGLYNGSNDTAASDEFVRDYTSSGAGLNGIVSLAGFADTNPVYNSMDAQGLHFMFDLRGSYKNLTETEQRVNTIKHHTSLFAYWTADEPDGWQVPFSKTPAAQSLIHTLDPYHPVIITLNCADYYFDIYSSGGDVLMEDTYPIGINGSFSKWGTVCNSTLGDCGCDDCYYGGVREVSTRLDLLATHEKNLGRWLLPKFHNPQAFHGEDYWARDPTPGEAEVMNALAFNRGATGIFAWTWPSSDLLFETHSHMAGVVTNPPVRDFLLGGKPRALDDLDGVLDTAYWDAAAADEGRILVSVVNSADEDVAGPVSLALPGSVKGIESVAFGGLSWQLVDGRLVIDSGVPAMSTSFIILTLNTAE